jgi:predicted RNA-binding protein with PIN domain
VPVVIVDARNVIRSRWPNFDEDRFLDLTRAWGDAEGARLVVVFDGSAPIAGVGSLALDDQTTVVGSGGESADDWIAENAAPLARAHRKPIWLVSSDRELRRRVAMHVERVVGGGSFAGALEALESTRRP